MSVKLVIFYLTDARRHHNFNHFINLITDSKYKNEWTLLILTHENDGEFYNNVMTKTNINYEIIKTEQDNNYLKKVFFANHYAEHHNIPYMMKCDNDIFIKHETLDYIFKNLDFLNNEKHLTISPCLSSGIPGIEYFSEQFLDQEEKSKLESLYLKTDMYNRDGVEYSVLNKHTTQADKWNKEEFFKGVKCINHHYKGVHPIRFNLEAINYLNSCIINKRVLFYKDHEMDIIYDNDSPYLCNSIFAIKTEVYKKIITDNSLYVDPFEEVPLNKYAWNNNMNHLFVKNGFAIHMYYNWNSCHLEFEKEFVKSFFE